MNDALFRIKKPTVTTEGFRAYWVESTAPLNVDDTNEKPPTQTLPLTEMNPDDAIAEIAAYLNSCETPQIVISVHGFNNPFPVVEQRFDDAYKYLAGDQTIKDSPGLVCVGYRWPSEAMGSPAKSVFGAAPRGLLWAFGLAVGLLLASLGLSTPASRRVPGRNLFHGLLYFLGSVCAAVPFTAFLERAVVYFRDGYRAVNYGVPDLLEVIRHLDREAQAQTPGRVRSPETRIKLSFIGHSMGGFVVTNLVRILSDVFNPDTMTATLAGSASSQAAPKAVQSPDTDADPDAMRRIGHVYTLERLVLVSPDIPAEALLQGRANFLQSSLRRFRESYLFSNEGDEALRLISTVANYFSFPTQRRDYGYRLGNVSIARPPKPAYGIVNLPRLRAGTPGEDRRFLDDLRVGRLTLTQLGQTITTDTGASAASGQDSPLPAQFTYFDCTDYVEGGKVVGGRVRGGQAIMTFAKRKAQLSDWDHVTLLRSYLLKQTPDVHSGYFGHPFSQCLIYRLACLGLHDTLQSPPPPGGPGKSGLDRWSDACAGHQIQVLLSPSQYALVSPQAKFFP